MPRRKLTRGLFDEMLASYEELDPMTMTVDEWAEQWPVSKQSFFSAMKVRGIVPKSHRPPVRVATVQTGASRLDVNEMSAVVELLLTARLRIRDLEARLSAAGLSVD